MYDMRARRVSFDDELLILVDNADNVTGYETKRSAHAGDGLLHRAFSIFLFNGRGEVLLHRRATGKPLWPGYWTNSCCSHPRKGESYAAAVNRRLDDELGVSAELGFVYQFEYQAAYEGKGSEHELCAVFVGRLDDDAAIAANPSEIDECRWIGCAELNRWISLSPEQFTPWFKLEWERLRTDQRDVVNRLCGAALH